MNCGAMHPYRTQRPGFGNEPRGGFMEYRTGQCQGPSSLLLAGDEGMPGTARQIDANQDTCARVMN